MARKALFQNSDGSVAFAEIEASDLPGGSPPPPIEGTLNLEHGGTARNKMGDGPGVVCQQNVGGDMLTVQGGSMTWVSGIAGEVYGASEQGMLNDLRDRMNGVIELMKLTHAIPGG